MPDRVEAFVARQTNYATPKIRKSSREQRCKGQGSGSSFSFWILPGLSCLSLDKPVQAWDGRTINLHAPQVDSYKRSATTAGTLLVWLGTEAKLDPLCRDPRFIEIFRPQIDRKSVV